MKKYIFGITALLLLCLASLSIAGSAVDKAFNENVRRSDGMITISVRDHSTDIALGLIDDEADAGKFARNIEIDSGVTADVWDGGHTVASGGVSLIWVAPTQARVHQLVSSSTSDDGDPAGVGARTVRVFYLKDWDTPELAIDVVMNGTTNVPLPSLVIINRMAVLTKGGTGVNVGIIKATADTDSTITSLIRVGQGQTQQAIMGVSSLDQLVLCSMDASANKAGGAAALADVSLLYNPEPDSELTNFLVKQTFGLMTVGTSAAIHPFCLKHVFEGPGILKIQVASGTNDMDVDAGWDAYIKTDIRDFTIMLARNRDLLTAQNGAILRIQ